MDNKTQQCEAQKRFKDLKRKNGNRYTSEICQTDVMIDFIQIWKNDFNARLIADKCNVTTNRASNFLYTLYCKSKIRKTKHRLKFGMINYSLIQSE